MKTTDEINIRISTLNSMKFIAKVLGAKKTAKRYQHQIDTLRWVLKNKRT